LITPDELAQVRHDLLCDQAIVGDPASWVRQIADLVSRSSIGHLQCVFNGNGALDRQTTLDGTELFALEVLPVCRTSGPSSVTGLLATR